MEHDSCLKLGIANLFKARLLNEQPMEYHVNLSYEHPNPVKAFAYIVPRIMLALSHMYCVQSIFKAIITNDNKEGD